ncbi:MAG: hypothetical protein ACJ73S_32440 [Mycobacteriales bacterium]
MPCGRRASGHALVVGGVRLWDTSGKCQPRTYNSIDTVPSWNGG